MSPVTAKTRLLLRVELRALIYRMDGEFYADAPQFGVWYNAESIDAASDGLIDGVTALLSTALERGTQHSYLTSRGFRTEGRTYRFPGEDKMLKKYFAHIEWPQEDVDRGHSICLEIELRALEVTNAFPELAPLWSGSKRASLRRQRMSAEWPSATGSSVYKALLKLGFEVHKVDGSHLCSHMHAS